MKILVTVSDTVHNGKAYVDIQSDDMTVKFSTLADQVEIHDIRASSRRRSKPKVELLKKPDPQQVPC